MARLSLCNHIRHIWLNTAGIPATPDNRCIIEGPTILSNLCRDGIRRPDMQSCVEWANRQLKLDLIDDTLTPKIDLANGDPL
jgi:hypothetical protein